MKPVYLDYNATTPLDREVADFMIPFLKDNFGNPGSTHSFGTKARLVINEARKKVAALLNCSPSEIIFTSGGTESNNLAITGYARANRDRGNHIITSQIEHPAVLEVCRELENEGFRLTYLPVSRSGHISVEELLDNLTESTILVSIMHANNETGVIQPVEEISALLKAKNIAFHCDAAQSAGKIEIDVKRQDIDLLSLAAHKFYGPKGVGALYIRHGITIRKILFGANHEMNLRPGTENLLEIAGMGKAAEIAARDLKENSIHMAAIRDKLYELLTSAIPNCIRNGNPDKCLPNTLNISFPGLDAATLLAELPDIAVSAGAACHAEDVSLSHVLKAMGIEDDLAMGTLRISSGKHSSLEEAVGAAEILSRKIKELTHKDDQVPYLPQEEDNIKLTRFTHGLGCACKISPRILEDILKDLPVPSDPNILVGTETSDDAAVYKINEQTAIVQTVDFFTPVVDDPFEFGEITAVNALSDVYAMGGKPLFGLNIVAFPPHRLPVGVLKKILEGAESVAKEAGISLLGGHTIEDNEPKFGMVITGVVHPDKILRNSGARADEAIILTKKIGTGILSTAVKRGLCSENTKAELYNSMRLLNKKAAEILTQYPVSACTDVTGFGLLGHLNEICKASEVSAEIFSNLIPWLPDAENFAAEGIIPGGTYNNLNYLDPSVQFSNKVPEHIRYLLADAQTSGGLLFTLPDKYADAAVKSLNEAGVFAGKIGNIQALSTISLKIV